MGPSLANLVTGFACGYKRLDTCSAANISSVTSQGILLRQELCHPFKRPLQPQVPVFKRFFVIAFGKLGAVDAENVNYAKNEQISHCSNSTRSEIYVC
jgi:hypothetical protein